LVQKNSKTKCSESDRAESLNIIIFFIIASFLTILFLYIIRFGYEGAPTLLEDILVIVLPPIIIILFIYRRTSYREPNGKKPCIQEHLTPEEGVTLIYKNFRCKICERHPYSQKYHLKKIHNLRNVNVKDYFVCCGCVICIERWSPSAG
jgi:hypothetical protein